MQKMGLVIQGGGALGAYEAGAVTRLIERKWQPVAVAGVSIGAINTAAIAGAKNGDIPASLKRLWDAITLRPNPFWPDDQQALFSMFGNPRFYQMRTDFMNMLQWTSLCDVSPMRKTLETLLDFNQINNADHIRCSVTATNVATGAQVSFSNHVTDPHASHRVTPKVKKRTLTPDHILASGSLPPGFPWTEIDGVKYWDGGLFDNTPIEALLDLLEEDEIKSMPIFVIDLFPTHGGIPSTLPEVRGRMMELAYENRFWAQDQDPLAGEGSQARLAPFAAMLEALEEHLPKNSPIRETEQFQRFSRLRALKNLHVISAGHFGMTGGADFSAYGITQQFKIGYNAVDHYFAEQHDLKKITHLNKVANLSAA